MWIVSRLLSMHCTVNVQSVCLTWWNSIRLRSSQGGTHCLGPSIQKLMCVVTIFCSKIDVIVIVNFQIENPGKVTPPSGECSPIEFQHVKQFDWPLTVRCIDNKSVICLLKLFVVVSTTSAQGGSTWVGSSLDVSLG